MATLTYVYGESTAVLGPLAIRAEPHGYDLCTRHAGSLSVPRGWEVIRLAGEEPAAPSSDDLLALADAVREVGFGYEEPRVEAGQRVPDQPSQAPAPGVVELRRRGHLTVLADPDMVPPTR